jgi:hypothetical protein
MSQSLWIVSQRVQADYISTIDKTGMIDGAIRAVKSGCNDGRY